MTASSVRGIPVLSNEDTLAPVKDRAGNDVHWKRVRTLGLADGSTIYGCSECDVVDDDKFMVWRHLSKHPKPEPELTAKSIGKLVDKLVTQERKEAVAAAKAARRRIKDVTKSRDEWRARAVAAEKSLQAIRSAFSDQIN